MSSGAGFDPGRSRLRLAEVRSRKGSVELLRYHTVDLAPGEKPPAAAGLRIHNATCAPPAAGSAARMRGHKPCGGSTGGMASARAASRFAQ